MAAKKPDWFPMDPAEFLSDAKVDLMSTLELGACFRLLCRQWIDGSLPDDVAMLGRICRLDAESMRAAWTILEPFFPAIAGGRRANRWMFHKREEVVADMEQRSGGASKAAQKRWADVKAKREKDAEGIPGASGPDAARINKDAARMPGAMQEVETELDTETELDIDKRSTSDAQKAAPPEAAASPIVIELPVLGKGAPVKIDKARVVMWAGAYPAVDVLAELRKMVAWLDANPTKKGSPSSTLRRAVNWLSRTQDKGGAIATAGAQTTRSPSHRARADEEHGRKLVEIERNTKPGERPYGKPVQVAGDDYEDVFGLRKELRGREGAKPHALP